MSAPYWGQLPTATAAAAPGKDRRTSEDYSRHTQDSQPLDIGAGPSRPNRVSVQTNKSANTDAPTESTLSPYASPTTSSFAGGGLAPRPPSLPYGMNQYPQDLLEKRARRASRNREEAAKLAAAMAPPQGSERQSYGNGPPSGSKRHSARRSVGGAADEYYKNATPEQNKNDYPVLDRSRQTFDAPSGSRRASASGDPSKMSSRRRSEGGGGGGGDGYANDHSPLKRLELTLDSITKEEKRARVEAAEQRARERAQRGQVPQQVRFSDRHAPTQQEAKHAPAAPIAGPQNPQRAPEPQHTSFASRAAPAQAASMPPPPAETSRGPGPLSQHPPEANMAYTPPPQATKPQVAPVLVKGPQAQDFKSSGIQRNLSFRERAARNEVRIPGVEDMPAPQAAPQAAPEEPRPSTGEHRRSFSLTRSGSNKLKKSPPHDTPPKFKKGPPADMPSPPEYGPRESPIGRGGSLRYKPVPPPPPAELQQQAPPRQKEAKSDHPIIPPVVNKLTKSPYGSQRRHSQDDIIPRMSSPRDVPPPQRAPSNRFAAPAAATAGAAVAPGTLAAGASRASPGNMHQEEDDHLQHETARHRREEGREDASSSSDGGRESPRSHNFTDRLYNAKKNMEPGHGVYLPPPLLDEWKKANVGTLEGDNLDISAENLEHVEGDKAWWEPDGRPRAGSMSSRPKKAEAFEGEYDDSNVPSRFKPNLYLKCGPLLRYCGMRTDNGPQRPGRGSSAQKRELWRGTVMIVTRDKDSSYDIVPTLRLFAQPIELLPPPPAEIAGGQALPPEYVDPLVGHTKVGRRGETLYVRPVEHLEEGRDVSRDETDDGLFEKTRSPPDYPVEDGSEPHGAFASRRKRIEVDGEKVGKFTEVRGFRLHAERGCTFWRFNIEVELRDKQQRIAYRINRGPATAFWVPAMGDSMNIMFYSCNGFSLSCDPNQFSGPDPLWRDVLNTHQTQPFHVMLGGGDQIYNDSVQEEAELFQEWLMIRNIYTKVHVPFSPNMQDELEEFYLERYCMWFSQGLFGLANSQIPMVNMYDDHDIIDGFGSYPHHFMNSPVFSGLGNVAFKYYMLFQHQTVIDETEASEPSWILGAQPGPYINSQSRSIFMMLGSKTALLAVDCRTERTREEIVSKETWDKIMDRCHAEIEKDKISHVLVLLGVPVAYPRLVWLENILTSRLMEPVKALGKAGMFGNLLNHLDGGVEVLDDLDDHWTSKSHKPERTIVVQDLQDLAADKSVRVTILSGDVHLGAVGQFLSNAKLGLAKHKDFRYMPNVISSAIVNTPPPDLLADVLNKRNKVHHFDKETDESMIPLFHHGVDGKSRNNKNLLPHRNWCTIREYVPGRSPPPTPNPRDTYTETPTSTPSVMAKSQGTGGLLRRLSRRGRSNTTKEPTDRSRPPVAKSGGLFRSFSRRGSSDHAIAPQPDQPPPPPKRTLSLTRGDFGGLFESLRRKKRPNDGGINGTWGDEDDDSYDSFEDERAAREQARHEYETRRGGHEPQPRGFTQGRMGMRGGGRATPPDEEDYEMEYEEGDDSYFTVRPSRTKSGKNPHKHHALGHHHPEPSSPVEMLHSAKVSHAKDPPRPLPEKSSGMGRWGSFGRSRSHSTPRQHQQQVPPPQGQYHQYDQPPPPQGRYQQPPPQGQYQQPTPQQQREAVQTMAQRGTPPTSSSQQQAPKASQDSFVPKPFHRTPTGMSVKQIKKFGLERVEVNLEGGLEITLNVEINQKDPSGITAPYKLLVPKLWYDYEGEEDVQENAKASAAGGSGGGGLGRWLSFSKGKKRSVETVSNSEGEGETESDEEGERMREPGGPPPPQVMGGGTGSMRKRFG
ncbi:hypothetical protein MKZ38_008898 [Zalerion maritima]|uniref:PhoD-like phosphatase domain-containing protein n=1 Tax=Zalerion maritima TaxID=339359 RepID=A0AAD5RTZ7_9PEZI|nr:hypothetical protein MKZ38_008898 [Zalerion maritima]